MGENARSGARHYMSKSKSSIGRSPLILLISASIAFFGASVYLLTVNRPLSSILSLVIALTLLGSALSIYREYRAEIE